jgi:Major royal jelly protein
VVDVDLGKCVDAFAYLPDDETWSLAVFSLATRKFWRIRHQFFHPHPLDGEFSLAGNKFQWDNGLFGLVLSARHPDGSRSVFFHALSSNHQFVTSNKVLQNETLATDKNLSFYSYGSVGSRGEKMQAASEVMDERTDTVFYALNNRNAIGCWNSKNPLSPKTVDIVATNDESLMWPNELQIDSNGNLWVLSNRLPLFIFGSLEPDDINYRILSGKSNLLIGEGRCDVTMEKII